MNDIAPIAPQQRVFFRNALLTDGWARDVRLLLSGGRIVGVETDTKPLPDDEQHGCAVPGMPNLHSHAFQRGMAGLAETRGPARDSFWTWREVMYRFLSRMTPDDMQAVAAMAYVEMAETGFTRVGEFHYVHHDIGGLPFADPAETSAAIASAAEESGIGLTLLPVFYAHSGFGGLPPTEGQARFINTVDSFTRLIEGARRIVSALPGGVVGIAPHSLRAVTPEELAALEQVGANGPIHIHIAEQVREVEDCLAWSGKRPVELLLDNAAVDGRWCLVHATHMTDAETGAMARAGAVAGLCPITEANLGDGIFPATDFIAAGGRFGVGSDSNVFIDASEELRLLEYGQRLSRRERNVLSRGEGRSTGADIYLAALEGGAQALGTETGLQVGAPADIVSLDIAHPSLAGREGDALLDGYVFAAGRDAIDCVWRHGRKLVSDGRHHEREPVRARYRAVLEKLLA